MLAISADSLESHQKFAEKLGGVPFPMLSDQDLKVIKLYGVLNDKGTGARRSVFVLAENLRILHANANYSLSNPMHYQEIFDALEL